MSIATITNNMFKQVILLEANALGVFALAFVLVRRTLFAIGNDRSQALTDNGSLAESNLNNEESNKAMPQL